MTKSLSPEFRARVENLDWYQRIPLDANYLTPGEDTFTEQKLPMLRFPENLSGRSVLDIGCSEGFFLLEAERRGAARIVGMDSAAGITEKVDLLRELTGSDIEFRPSTVYDLSIAPAESFDLVIFLSVFQHLDHPYRALDLISAATGITAIMEIPIAVSLEDDEAFQAEPYAITRRSPKGRRIFLPNEALLSEMLSDAGFAAIDRLVRHRPREVPGYDARYRQERLILHAHKGSERL